MSSRFAEGPGGLIIDLNSGAAVLRLNVSDIAVGECATMSRLIIDMLNSEYAEKGMGEVNGKNRRH